jgi:hypothetical protein
MDVDPKEGKTFVCFLLYDLIFIIINIVVVTGV